MFAGVYAPASLRTVASYSIVVENEQLKLTLEARDKNDCLLSISYLLDFEFGHAVMNNQRHPAISTYDFHRYIVLQFMVQGVFHSIYVWAADLRTALSKLREPTPTKSVRRTS